MCRFGERLRRVRIWAHSRRKGFLFEQCGGNLFLTPPTTIIGGENIRIGSDFTSMGNCYFYANDGSLDIGDNCSVNTNVQFGASQGQIRIGNRVLIGPNVVMRAADHGIADGSPVRSQAHSKGEIVVEDDVWIGANAVITRNVTLGSGCVIGAGAVVTHDIPPNAIAVGVPAAAVGYR